MQLVTSCGYVSYARSRQRLCAVVLTVLVLVAVVGAGLSADEYELARSTIDAGGAMNSTGGDFELSGTIGQPDARVLTGGEFTLAGGFWFPVAPGDVDEDGAVGLVDFEVFNSCLLGPVDGLGTGCNHLDSDRNGHIDLHDYAAFQSSFTGSP